MTSPGSSGPTARSCSSVPRPMPEPGKAGPIKRIVITLLPTLRPSRGSRRPRPPRKAVADAEAAKKQAEADKAAAAEKAKADAAALAAKESRL